MGILKRNIILHMLKRAMKSCFSRFSVKFVSFVFSLLSFKSYHIFNLAGKILINKFTDSLEIRRATEEYSIQTNSKYSVHCQCWWSYVRLIIDFSEENFNFFSLQTSTFDGRINVSLYRTSSFQLAFPRISIILVNLAVSFVSSKYSLMLNFIYSYFCFLKYAIFLLVFFSCDSGKHC